MKKNLFLLLVGATLIWSCKSGTTKGENGISYKSPQEYNDYIVSRQSTIMKRIIDFTKVAEANLDSAEAMLDGLVKQTETMRIEIKGMPAYKGDSTLRDAAVGNFGFYNRIFNKQYRDIIHLRKEQDGTSVEIQDRIEALVNEISEEEKGYDERFEKAQRTFAKKNNLLLRENEMQKQIDKLGEN